MSHTIEDLREHLFEALERLKTSDDPAELDRARAVAGVAKVITDGAKVEVDFLRVTGASSGSGFFQEPEALGRERARGKLGSQRAALLPPAANACAGCGKASDVRDRRGLCPRCERKADQDTPLGRR